MTDLTPAAPSAENEPGMPTGLSIASLVTGISGAVLTLGGLGFLPSLAAVITGHLARTRNPEARAFWIAGLVLGYVGLALSVLIVIVVIVASAAFFLTIGGVLGAYY